MKSESSDMKTQSIKEMDKLDQVEQYGRRLNLEIVGVPVQENEDTSALVIEVAKLLDVRSPSGSNFDFSSLTNQPKQQDLKDSTDNSKIRQPGHTQ